MIVEVAPVFVTATAISVLVVVSTAAVSSYSAAMKLNTSLTIVVSSGNTTSTPTTPNNLRHALRLLHFVNSHLDVHLASLEASRSKSKTFHMNF